MRNAFKALLFISIILVFAGWLGHRASKRSALAQSGQQPISFTTSTTVVDTTYSGGAGTLTGNVSAYQVIAGTRASQLYGLTICQPAGVAYTVSGQPANVIGTVAVPTTAGDCQTTVLMWVPAQSSWIGTPVGSIPVTPVFSTSASALPAGANPTSALSGAYPNLLLSLGIPAGAIGTNGTNGTAGTNGTNASSPVFTATATSLAAGSTPTTALTGTYPNLNIAYGIPTGNAGATGPAGVMYYGTAGALTNVKCAIGSVASSTSGQWSATYANAGITTLITLDVSAVSAGTSAATTFMPTIVTRSATGASGSVFNFVTSVVGIVPLTQATASTTVMYTACGT